MSGGIEIELLTEVLRLCKKLDWQNILQLNEDKTEIPCYAPVITVNGNSRCFSLFHQESFGTF